MYVEWLLLGYMYGIDKHLCVQKIDFKDEIKHIF